MSAAEDCPLCDDGIIVTVEYSLIGNPPERSGVPCWRCLTARAEKAEQERDDALAQIDAHLNLCGGAPMTTVDEDGRVWRVVFAEAWDRAPSDPDRVTVYYEDEDRPDDAPPMYVLVPIEDAP